MEVTAEGCTVLYSLHVHQYLLLNNTSDLLSFFCTAKAGHIIMSVRGRQRRIKVNGTNKAEFAQWGIIRDELLEILQLLGIGKVEGCKKKDKFSLCHVSWL